MVAVIVVHRMYASGLGVIVQYCLLMVSLSIWYSPVQRCVACLRCTPCTPAHKAICKLQALLPLLERHVSINVADEELLPSINVPCCPHGNPALHKKVLLTAVHAIK
jgi:hypothetical protein